VSRRPLVQEGNVSVRKNVTVLAVVLLALGAGSAVTLFLTHSGPFLRTAGSLTARIVDDESGEPLAARVSVVDASWRPVALGGRHEHVQHLGRTWDYVDGAFSVVVPADGATIEIRRGLETRLVVESIAPGGAGRGVSRTFRLRRWSNLRARGYVSGDLHSHLPALDAAALQVRAEDLDALNLLILGGLPQPNDTSFAGHVDPRSPQGHSIYLSQEIVDWQLGHLTLAGIDRLVPGYPESCGTLEYWTSHPHCDIQRAGRAARQQGALVSLAHFENLPGAATPVAVALGLLDALEIPTWSDPMQLPAHLDPWSASGMSTAEFPPMRGVDLYYQYLNAGFRLSIAAGTDKSGDDIPVGSNRVYAATKGKSDFAAWLTGIKAGTGFVTNGPLLEFDVDGHGPGEEIPFDVPRTVKVRARARSLLPFTTLEVVLNGSPVAHVLRLVQANAPVDGVYTLETEATVRLERSAWFAARAFADPDITPRLLPRQASVFAHTNPVYFLREGRRVREAASIAYLRRSVDALRAWLSTGPPFATESDRNAVRRDAEQALRVYDGL
jgi:hypothetical protein